MTTEKVIAIVAVMMFLEYLYVKQNAASIVSGALSGAASSSAGNAAGVGIEIAAGAAFAAGSQIVGLL